MLSFILKNGIYLGSVNYFFSYAHYAMFLFVLQR